jgi:RNA polymerase sigma-70 factor (ECF subfamily)
MLLTLAEAAQRIRSFNPRKATLSAWLYGVARRHVQRELRVRNRRKSVPASAQVPLEDMGEQAIQEDIADSVAARLQAQLTVMELRRCLSDIEMEVLILHCMHQLSAIEIGKVLGRSERAIDSLLRRARQKARERLAQDER